MLGSGTQLDGLSSVLSFEEPAGYDPETDEEIPLGDMLAACMGEDQLEQLVRDGEITEEVADQIGLAVLFGNFREECISR